MKTLLKSCTPNYGLIRITLILFVLFSFQNVNAQKLKGNKNVTIVDRELESFHSIIVSDKLDINLIPSRNSGVSIETDENLHVAIGTEISAGVLSISLDQKIQRKKTLKINVRVTDSIQLIEVSDKASVLSANVIHSESLTLKATEHAKLDLVLDTYTLDVFAGDRSTIRLKVSAENSINLELSGRNDSFIEGRSDSNTASLTENASIKLTGTCNELNLTVNDNGSCKAKEYSCDNAVVTVADKADVDVNVKTEIEILASDSSEMNLYGEPSIIINSFTGKAKLSKKEI